MLLLILFGGLGAFFGLMMYGTTCYKDNLIIMLIYMLGGAILALLFSTIFFAYLGESIFEMSNMIER